MARKLSVVSTIILLFSVPVYAGLCWPAIQRRGFPEIDPFWLAMPWLWGVPILLSAPLEAPGSWRRWRVGIYTILTSVYFAGTGAMGMFVPHHVTFADMLGGALFPWGPINLLIAFGIEWLTQRCLRLARASAWNPEPTRSVSVSLRTTVWLLLVLGAAISFPFACRSAAFAIARSEGNAAAQRDWAHGQAVRFVPWGSADLFGAPPGRFDATTGLRVKWVRPGVTDAIYCAAYGGAISNLISVHGPAPKAKELCAQSELETWIKQKRFKRADRLPLRQSGVEIGLTGVRGKDPQGDDSYTRHPASAFLYHAVIPEKNDTLVVITDDAIWVFGKSGDWLQSVDSTTYRAMGITEAALR